MTIAETAIISVRMNIYEAHNFNTLTAILTRFSWPLGRGGIGEGSSR